LIMTFNYPQTFINGNINTFLYTMCLVAILWKDMCLINTFDGLPACKVNTYVL